MPIVDFVEANGGIFDPDDSSGLNEVNPAALGDLLCGMAFGD